MSFISTIVGLLSGITGIVLNDTGVTGLEWWQTLIISLSCTLFGFLLDLVAYILKAKKIISEEDTEKLLERLHKKEDEKKTDEEKGEN